MTTPTATANDLRPDALKYLRSGRLGLWWATSAGPGQEASVVRALVSPAPGDPSGLSVHVNVSLHNGVWHCDAPDCADACPHRLAAQMITGWAHLGGKCQP